MPDVICLGEVLVDFVSADGGSLADGTAYTKAIGGSPAVVALGLARLGMRAGFVGRVGNDAFGGWLRDSLRKARVDTEWLRNDEQVRTTLTFSSLRDGNRRETLFYRHPGADQRLHPNDIDESYLIRGKALYFGGVSLTRTPAREATLLAAGWARDAGMLVTYAPNWQPSLWEDAEMAREQLWNALEFATVVKVRSEELEFFASTNDLAKAASKILAEGPKLVVVTRGPQACYARTPLLERTVSAYPIALADSLGAGDAFMAAMISRLLPVNLETVSEADLDTVLRFANAAAALVCTKSGAVAALPDAREIECLLKAGVTA